MAVPLPFPSALQSRQLFEGHCPLSKLSGQGYCNALYFVCPAICRQSSRSSSSASHSNSCSPSAQMYSGRTFSTPRELWTPAFTQDHPGTCAAAFIQLSLAFFHSGRHDLAPVIFVPRSFFVNCFHTFCACLNLCLMSMTKTKSQDVGAGHFVPTQSKAKAEETLWRV